MSTIIRQQADGRVEITTTVTIKDCRDCFFAKSHYGHGECWTECQNKANGRRPYENILWGCNSKFEAVPVWCPIGLGGKRA